MPEQSDLHERLAVMRARYPDMDPAMVVEVVRAVLGSMHGDLNGTQTGLLAEVEALGRTIATAKADIAALRVDDITGNHIPAATDELDAIVAHTAAATDQILEVCETLDDVGAKLRGKAKAQLQDATTRIYEACSFQDITGQRITKVVAALKTIEQKVAMLIYTFGDDPAATPPEIVDGEAALLNGPQLPAAAMDQSDIDRLLASFDS
jgi:chemotaxis protein CheZ